MGTPFRKKYCVVYFVNEDAVELVASNWLSQLDTRCSWPTLSGLQLNSKIRNCVAADPVWPVYEVKVIRFCDDYVRGRQRADEAVNNSELESSASETSARKLRQKRKITSRLTYSPLHRSLAKRPTPLSSSEEEVEGASNSLSENEIAAPNDNLFLPPSTATSIGQQSINFTPEQGNYFELSNLNASTDNVGEFSIPVTISSASGGEFQQQCAEQCAEKMDQLVSSFNGFKNVVLRELGFLKEEIRLLRAKSTRESAVAVEEIVDEPRTPLNSLDELSICDSWLNLQTNFEYWAVRFGRVGGKIVASAVRKILRNLIGPDLATRITLTGKTGKTALKSTNLHRLIQDAIKKHGQYKSTTDSEIDEVMMNWFRFSRKRLESQKKVRVTTSQE